MSDGDEPGARNEVSGTVFGNVVQANHVDSVTINTGAPAPPPPRMLPRNIVPFVDRDDAFAAIDGHVDTARAGGGAALLALTGVGGVGKTATGVRWAHRAAGRFPGGQLYADLQGSSLTGPANTGDVLAHFLRLLGHPPDDLPSSTSERASLFRSLVADRDVVVLLDDAASAAQVRDLLPGSSRAVVLVTSRTRLDGLVADGFRVLRLGPLDRAVAVELLVAVTQDRDRAVAEPDAVDALAELCGRLPLALRVAAGRLAAHRGPVSGYVRRLSAGGALRRAHDEDVTPVFEASYRALDEETARAYRLLALWPGPDLPVEAAAALLDRSEDETRDLLDALVEENLLDVDDQDRYSYHLLVRLHGVGRAESVEGVEARRAAVGRAVDWWLRFAIPRDRMLLRGRPHVNAERYAELADAPGPADEGSAVDELDAERANLFAAVFAADMYGLADLCWQLCEAVYALYLKLGYHDDWLDTHRLGVDAAHAAGNGRAELRMRVQLGGGYFAAHREDDAEREFVEAFRLAGELGDDLARQSAVEWQGFVWERRGDPGRALARFARSREIAASLGAERVRADALLDMHSGRALKDLARYDEAFGPLARALEYFERAGDRTNIGKTLTSIGQAHLGAGRVDEAVASLTRAVDAFGARDSRDWQAEALESLADAHERLGDRDAALACLDRAAAMYGALGRESRVAEVLARSDAVR